MGLLETNKIELHEFVQDNVPEYAILSHRWTKDEISLQDLSKGLTDAQKEFSGFKKIVSACRIAKENGFLWLWIATCCIDKSSSAELSEAINSMFQWYQRSVVCFAYLADAKSSPSYYTMCQSFRGSEWFTRGWTLQELLAPSQLIFLDQTWGEIGTRKSLEREVSEVTSIPARYLNGNAPRLEGGKDNFDTYSPTIAQIMSWASGRSTTRLEDEAYCLLGLFGVNMPLLYGEGDKAFTRLQLEIIKQSDDDSIFTWSRSGAVDVRFGLFGDLYPGTGMLARSVQAFESCGDIRPMRNKISHEPYTMTNRGLQIKPTLASLKGDLLSDTQLDWRDWRVMLLNCQRDPSSPLGGVGQLGVLLDKPSADGRVNRLSVVPVTQACSLKDPLTTEKTFYVKEPETQHSFRVFSNISEPTIEQIPDPNPFSELQVPFISDPWQKGDETSAKHIRCNNDDFAIIVGVRGAWSGLGLLLIPDCNKFTADRVHFVLETLGLAIGTSDGFSIHGSSAFSILAACFSDRAAQRLQSGASVSASLVNRAGKAPIIRVCYQALGRTKWPERERLHSVKQMVDKLLDGSLAREAKSAKVQVEVSK